MDKKIKILVVQNCSVIRDKEANFKKVEALLKPFENSNIDLIVLPEVWAVGWYCKAFTDAAEEENNSITLNFLSNLAKKFNSNVVGGSYIKKYQDAKLTNNCPVFDREGNLIAQYEKMHLFSHFGADEGQYATKGSKQVIAKTDVAKLGLSICYDIRFPELFRVYAYNGVDILINVAAWPKTRKNHWVTLQKARAIENQAFVIAASQTGLIKGDEYNLGHSMVISPYGEVIAELNEEEAVLEAEIDLSEMKTLREKFPILADRADNYSILEG